MPERQLVCAFIALWWTLGVALFVLNARTAWHAIAPGSHGIDLHVALIASMETVGALLFLFPPTLRVGGYTLLATFAAAFLLHLAHGEFPGQILIDAAGVLFVVVHGPVTIGADPAAVGHPGP